MQGRDYDSLKELFIKTVWHMDDKFLTLVKRKEEVTQEGELHSLLTSATEVHVKLDISLCLVAYQR